VIVLELHLGDPEESAPGVADAQTRILEYARELGIEVRIRRIEAAPNAAAERRRRPRFSIG
jgi:hypothetical protein